MFFPDRKIVERIKKEYPSGTRVELVELNDPYRHLPAGLQGTVSCVDDTGQRQPPWGGLWRRQMPENLKSLLGIHTIIYTIIGVYLW